LINIYYKLPCQLRTNFIRYDPGYEGSLITYWFDEYMESDLIALRALLYTYFDFQKSQSLMVYTSIEKLLNIAGAKGDAQKYKSSKIYTLLTKCFSWFIENKYIKLCAAASLDDYKFKELVEIQIVEENFYLSVKRVGGKDKADEPFFMITEEEFNSIVSSGQRNLLRLFYVFAYIKSCIAYRLPKGLIAENPKVALLTQDVIVEHTGYPQSKLSKYISVLCDIDVLKRKQLKRTDQIHKPPYIYAASEEGWEQELHYGALKYNEKREDEEKE